MKIVCISDTHSQHNLLNIPDGDMIIFSGDCSGRGKIHEVVEFIQWFGGLPHKYKVMVAGNHDWSFQTKPNFCKDMCIANNIYYLYDTSVIIEGIKIHGTPVTPRFFDWAFNRAVTIEDANTIHCISNGQGYIGEHWDKIPLDTDILVTHGPPYSILDETKKGDKVGCKLLCEYIFNKLAIKYHIFGHIHEAVGQETLITNNNQQTTFVNASVLNERYKLNKKQIFVLEIK